MLNLNKVSLAEFRTYLMERECSKATIDKYMRDVCALADFSGEWIKDKHMLLEFKEHLVSAGYAVSSINSMIASVNGYLAFRGFGDWKLRTIRMQRSLFIDEKKELNRKEYECLVCAAQKRKDKRLALLLQTICSTGIRVSELSAITVESLQCARARIYSKGKVRLILIPVQLCRILKCYCAEKNIRSGSVFVTRNGQPLDRSNIWKMMKRLASDAGVALSKVFPHNLRHLFACTYYREYKDIVRLADILGHSSVNTTRIYTSEGAERQVSQIARLPLLTLLGTT